MTIEELLNAMNKREKIYIIRGVGYYPRVSYEIYEVEILGFKTYNIDDSMEGKETYIDLDFRLSCGVEDGECFHIERLHKDRECFHIERLHKDRESAEVARDKLQKEYIETFKNRALSEIRQLMKEFEIGIDDLKEEK